MSELMENGRHSSEQSSNNVQRMAESFDAELKALEQKELSESEIMVLEVMKERVQEAIDKARGISENN